MGHNVWRTSSNAVNSCLFDKPSDEDEEQTASRLCRKRKSEEPPTISVLEEESAKLENDVKSAAKPVVCFQCKKRYSDHYGVMRHFRALHLQDPKCNACEVQFQHKMHIQNHAQVVHRLRLARWAETGGVRAARSTLARLDTFQVTVVVSKRTSRITRGRFLRIDPSCWPSLSKFGEEEV